MFAIRGIAFAGPGPVKAGYIELADVTVLIGPNDVGKTRILRLIESALNEPLRPFSVHVVDVFGFAAKAELDAFVDADFPDDRGIRRETVAIAGILTEVDYGLGDVISPIGVRVSGGTQKRLPTWRYGRAAVELSDDARARLTTMDLSWRDEREPVKTTYLGGADAAILPLAVAVPGPVEAVEAEAAAAVEDLCLQLRLLGGAWNPAAGLVGELEGGPPVDWMPFLEALDDESPHAPARWLLDEGHESASVHMAAKRACLALERTISRLLPDFISDAYDVEVALGSPVEIARGDAIRLLMSKREAEPDPKQDTVRFSIRDAASGYTVWLQLAVREAAARIMNLAQIIFSWGERAAEPAFNAMRGLISEEEAREDLNEIKNTIELALAALDQPADEPGDSIIASGLEPIPETTIQGNPNTGEWSIFRPRLYVIDEPEQRLHPALQRKAAQWLVNLMGAWGSKCLLATHSFAFIDLPGTVSAYEVFRSANQATLKAFDITAFSPHAQLARAIGLDRGELLSRWRAFLFVEGLADAAVIEELCAETLAHTRIRVVPVHGHRHHAGLLDMTLLVDAVSVPIAVLLDSISQQDVADLRACSARDRARAMEEGSELGTAARIIDLELKRERSIEIFTIGVYDIFDLLDEQVIRDLSRPRASSSTFPGHAAARASFSYASRRRDQAGYKKFLADTYGVSTNATAMRRVARTMHDRGIPVPKAIADVLTDVERLAISADAVP